MKIYITGATGFVGSAVVHQALQAGHEVCAVVRPASKHQLDDHGTGRISEARVDLRSIDGLADSLEDVDIVIHLAAAKAGDFATQFAGTVVATENLLAAMETAGVKRLIGISTFSVYDYLALKPGDLVDESSPTDQTPKLRDEYAQTKLIQEDLYRAFAEKDDNQLVILRPGMIYGRDNLWHALLGAEMGPRFLKIGSKATLPLTFVDNCADAIVLAAEVLHDAPHRVNGEVINIVDDNLPTQSDYATKVAARIDVPQSIQVPWPAMNAAASALKKGNQVLLNGRAKFPGIAVPDRLHARFKPLNYTNAKAKDLLGWVPRRSLDEAIELSSTEVTT